MRVQDQTFIQYNRSLKCGEIVVGGIDDVKQKMAKLTQIAMPVASVFRKGSQDLIVIDRWGDSGEYAVTRDIAPNPDKISVMNKNGIVTMDTVRLIDKWTNIPAMSANWRRLISAGSTIMSGIAGYATCAIASTPLGWVGCMGIASAVGVVVGAVGASTCGRSRPDDIDMTGAHAFVLLFQQDRNRVVWDVVTGKIYFHIPADTPEQYQKIRGVDVEMDDPEFFL